MDNIKNYRDLELIRSLRSGSHAAFEKIYEIYWPILFLHAHKMIKDEDAATDIVQDVFMDLWHKSSSIQINHSLKAYLYKAVRYSTLLTMRKSGQNDKFLSSLVDFTKIGYNDVDEEYNLKELIERIESEIELLPPKMRKIFELSRFSGMSHQSIAEELTITDHTVKKTINRVLHILRSKITILFLICLLAILSGINRSRKITKQLFISDREL